MRARKAYAAPAALAAFLITASGPVLAQTGQSSGSAAGVASSSDPRPIQDLMKAAQQLRDATHDLVREQPSARRNAIISKIDKTLVDVQGAMVNLPPDVNEAESKKASSNLATAADRLEQSSKALGADASPQQRSQAMNEIRQALAEVQQERLKISGGPTTSGSGGAPDHAGRSPGGSSLQSK